jgi:Tfp pilus assembly protein PilF
MTKVLHKTLWLFLAVTIPVTCGTCTWQPDTVLSGPLGKALVQFNRGAALLEQYKYSEAGKAFEKVLKYAPDWNAARFNLGLAYFNMLEDPGAIDYLKKAQGTFEAVLQSDPNHLHAQFCLGLYHEYIGETEKALEYFRPVHEADSKDLYVAYKYASTLLSTGSKKEGTEVLETIVSIDPGFISAVYRLAMQYQRMKQREKAMALFNRFLALKETELTGGSFTVLQAYGTVGKYFMALGPDNLPLPSRQYSQQVRILFSPELKHLNAETYAWKTPGGTVALPGIATGDIDGDGDLDLCITAFGADGGVRLWRNDGIGGFSQDVTLAQQGISPCFGDVDNDGDLDLWLGCAGPDLYFENDGKGNFRKSDVPAIVGGNLVTSCARLLDIDSDGDLDFLTFRFVRGSVPAVTSPEPTAGSLYNNNRDGSFTDIAEKLGLTFEKTPVTNVVYDDFDNDRDLDLVVFSTGNSKAVAWVNDRAWKYRILDAEATGLSVEGVLSATSGDPDKDGDRDLLIFTNKSSHLFMNQGGFRFARHGDFSDYCGRLGGTGGQFADMDNDGDLDILIADAFKRDGSRGPALLINDWPRDPLFYRKPYCILLLARFGPI